MTTSIHTPRALAAFALLGALCIPQMSGAQTESEPKTGYLTDRRNNHVTAGDGVTCWHTREWTPELALEPCDPVAKKVVIVQVQPAPMTTQPAAPPAPPVVAAAALPTRMHFSADALFGFDKSVIGPEGRKMLDDLAVQLKTATVDVIHVTGHTDRLGSTAYNQKLSERRAQAVRAYIVAGGFPDNKIDATGVGKSQPVTLAQDCKGRQSAKVIACLQPDRRVELELQGTQPAQP